MSSVLDGLLHLLGGPAPEGDLGFGCTGPCTDHDHQGDKSMSTQPELAWTDAENVTHTVEADWPGHGSVVTSEPEAGG